MIIVLVLFLLIAPYLVGVPIRKVLDGRNEDAGTAYITGVMTMLVLSGVIHFSVMYTNGPFSLYLRIYPLVLFVVALAGVVCSVFDIRKGKIKLALPFKDASKEALCFMALNAVVFLLCVIRILVGKADVSGDFTIETIRTTLQTDSIYQYNSFTGMLIEEGMPIRQQILTLPFFQAFLAESFNVAADVVLYKVFPCFVLGSLLLVYWMLAKKLFPENQLSRLIFMFIIGFMLLVGDYGVTSLSALILHRGFTGYALCVGVFIPFTVYVCLSKKWLLALVCAAAELFVIWTTYGLGFCVLTAFLFGIIEVAGRLKKK